MKQLLLFSFFTVLLSSFVQAQQDVSGKVTDARDNLPLSGVNIFVKGSRTGTSTDAEGRFRISVAANATLVFSSIGFNDKEIKVTSGSINVSLEIAEKTCGKSW